MNGSVASDRTEYPVVVVGAGPVGLALVLALRRQGIDAVAFDLGEGAGRYPKARLVSARSMELLRRWGVADEVRRAALPGPWRTRVIVAQSVTGTERARVEVPPTDGGALSPEESVICTQDRLEPILAAAVRAIDPTAVRWSTAVTQVDADDEGATVQWSDAAGHAGHLRGRFVVFADGVHGVSTTSMVPGAGKRRVHAREISLRTELDLDGALVGREAFAYYLVDKGLSAQMLVVDGSRDWVLSTLAGRDETPADYPLERVRALMVAITGLAPDDARIRTSSVRDLRFYDLGLRIAETFRAGALLRAGDAAHEVFPTGAIGMNVGLADIGDLAWRLTAVVRGWAAPGLLDDYDVERRAVAKRSAAYSRAILNALTTMIGAAARGQIDQLEAAALGYRRYVDHPGLDFPPSTWCAVEDADELVADGRPGSRAPHLVLADGTSTLDHYDDSSVVVLTGGGSADAVSAADTLHSRTGLPVRVLAMNDLSAARDGSAWWVAHGVGRHGVVVVRPDGYVAWRHDGPAIEEVVSAVEAVARPMAARVEVS